MTTAESSISITELVIYPIKGCAGISLPSAIVTPLGLASPNNLLRDRTWLVVKPENGKFITQRQKPALSLVKTRVDPPAALFNSSSSGAAEEAEPVLVLSAPGMSDLRIPLAQKEGKPSLQVTVWDWTGAAVDEGAAAAAWFSDYLGCPAKLTRYAGDSPAYSGSDFKRKLDPMWSPEGQEAAFADGFPYLVVNEASLDDLNRQLGPGNAILLNRFRPNIVVRGSGTEAWAEDQWKEVQFNESSGGPLLLNVKPCSRCKVPTINQETGEVGSEPARTLMQSRSGAVLGWVDPPSFKISVFFGSNMCCTSAAGGMVAVGDEMKVLTLNGGPIVPRR